MRTRLLSTTLLLCATISCICQGQSNRKDSLLAIIHKQSKDTNTVFAHYHYGEYFENDHPDSADWYYRKGLQMAENIGHKKGIASYASYALVLLNNQGDYVEGLRIAQHALDLFEKGVGTERDLAVGHINIGNEWQYLGDLKQAAAAYIQGAQYAEGIEDQFLLRICYNNLASIFIELKDYQKVLKYATKAYDIATNINNAYGRASSMINIAVSEIELNSNYQQAIVLYDSVAAIGERLDDPVLEMDALNGRGEVYGRMKKFEQASEQYNALLTAAKTTGQLPYEMFAEAGLAGIDEHKGLYETAASHIQSAIALAEKIGALLEQKNYIGLD